MNNKGFSLIEIFITMAIMAVVMAMSGPLYTRVLRGVKAESTSSEAYQDLITATAMIRLDIEHAGVGIPRDEAPSAAPALLPVAWTEGPTPPTAGTSILDLRSTMINTNQTTMGWGMLDCTGAAAGGAITAATYIVNLKDTPGLQSMVLLDDYEQFETLTAGGSYNCPATPGYYTAYPYDPTSTNNCNMGWCTRTRYSLSAAHGAPTSPAACAQGTFNLLRAVGNGAGDPIVNCVADFRVRFDLDNSTNGMIDATEANALPAVPDPLAAPPVIVRTAPLTPIVRLPERAGYLMDRVRNMEVLLLVQVGQKDDRLNTSPNTTVAGTALSLAGVTAPTSYRWKILKISGKPMSW